MFKTLKFNFNLVQIENSPLILIAAFFNLKLKTICKRRPSQEQLITVEIQFRNTRFRMLTFERRQIKLIKVKRNLN